MLWTPSRYMHEMSISNRLWLLYYQSCRHFSFKGSTRVRMDRTNSRIALSELGARRSSLHMLGLIHLLDPFFLKVSSRCSGAAGFLMDMHCHPKIQQFERHPELAAIPTYSRIQLFYSRLSSRCVNILNVSYSEDTVPQELPHPKLYDYTILLSLRSCRIQPKNVGS
jgi:hypothetical protein